MKSANEKASVNDFGTGFINKKTLDDMREYYLKGYKDGMIEGVAEFFDDLAQQVLHSIETYEADFWMQIQGVAKEAVFNEIPLPQELVSLIGGFVNWNETHSNGGDAE